MLLITGYYDSVQNGYGENLFSTLISERGIAISGVLFV